MHLRWLDGAIAGVPIMMSATGPRNLRLAGSLADRVMLYVGVTPEAVQWALRHVHEGARSAGRDPVGQLKVSILCAMHVSDDKTRPRPTLPVGTRRVREPHRRHGP